MPVRKLVILITGLGVLALVNYSIYQKEQLLTNGRVVFLELAPVDPRSLMQGDYMALRFRIEEHIGHGDSLPHDSQIVVGLDDRGVGTFRREHGEGLAADEINIYCRVRDGRYRIGTNAFFFQEGDGHYYDSARFGEARVDQGGQLILVSLRDAELKMLGPPERR